MKHSIVKTLILAGALAAAGGALAFGGHHGFGGKECNRGEHGMKGVMQLESITEEQREQIVALRGERREAMQSLREQMRENRKALRNAAREGAPEATVAALAEKQGDLVEQMIIGRMQMRRKVDGILTEEQRRELAEMREARHGRMGE